MKLYQTYSDTKKLSLLILLFLINAINSIAQYNFVPNPSFEDYTVCPNTLYPLPPTIWYPPTNYGLGYYNVCSTSPHFGVPYNAVGTNYQYPRTGNAYIGLDLVNQPGSDFRYYFQVKLKDSLRKGHLYYAEFYAVCDNFRKLKCNNVSMLLTNMAVYVDTINYPYGLLPANAQICNYGNPIITDTLNWVKISSIYKSQGGEQYLTLGNFKDDAHTNYIATQPTGYNGADAYFDDVSVIPLDNMPLKADAGRDTVITVGDSAFIGSLTNGIDTVKWQVLNTNGTIDSIRPGFWVHPLVNTCYVLTQTVNGYTSSDTVCVSVQTVPLKFLKFTVLYQPTPNPSKEGNVKLDWVTANEINVSHFYVQRSTNGRDFVIIHKEQANNQALNNYIFIDETPNEGVNYYRIVSVDKDGKVSYSEVRQIIISKEQLAINIFPNPARDFISVVGKSIKEIQIINQLGQVVYKEIATGTNLRNDATIINIKNLNKGLYVVQVINAKGEVKNEKLIVE